MSVTEIPNDIAAIGDNLRRVRERIANAAVQAGRRPEDVTLVAVSKTKPIETISPNAAIIYLVPLRDRRSASGFHQFGGPDDGKAACCVAAIRANWAARSPGWTFGADGLPRVPDATGAGGVAVAPPRGIAAGPAGGIDGAGCGSASIRDRLGSW
jgi:hypothetical protein